MSDKQDALLARVDTLLGRIESLFPTVEPANWDEAVAFRWRTSRSAFGQRGRLQPVHHLSSISLSDLKNIPDQIDTIATNTRQFVKGLPANNVLLTGSRGTGKSSLVKACLNEFKDEGLRLVEVDKEDLVDLGDIVDMLATRPERFIVFSDDLSFEDGEAGYKALKSVLDGSVAAQSDNVLIYATSNRRHLMPEYMKDNLAAKHQQDGEIHHGEGVEEKVSLSERFGLWVAFYPFRQDDYLAVCAHWLRHFDVTDAQIEEARADALRFALERGSRSGRVAWQFARDYAGRLALEAGGAR